MNFERLSRIREQMKQLSFDHLIITSPDAIFYLLDEEIHPGERLLALSVNNDKCTLFISGLFPMQRDLGIPVIYYKDTEDSVQILSESISPNSHIGIDKNWQSHFLLRLMKLKASSTFENGSPAVDNVRLCKDVIETERMRKASLINDQVMTEVMNYIKENAPVREITELEVQKKVVEINAALGVHEMSFTPTVCFGKNGAEPHHDCDNTVLKPNDSVVVDIGGRLDGYCSDMTRSFVYGTPSQKYTEVYNLVLEANKKAISLVKSGVKLSEVDRAAREVIEAGGYGDYFTHRTGHGIGINVHEFPDVSEISNNICEVGMAFSIEPGIYLLGEFGVRIEDIVMVTENGCEILNHVEKSLLSI